MKMTNQWSIAISMRWTMKCFVLLGLLLPATIQVQSQAGANPILPGYQADPDIQYYNGKYYIYPTGGSQFHAWSSTDLTNWVDEGVIFDLGPDCSWANVNGWAPTVIFRNNKYYFYYTAEFNIGVAVGNSPTGPFVDKGSQLIGPAADPNNAEIIDPAVFVDDNGNAYIYYGGSYTSRMNIRKLNPDMISTDPSFGVVDATPPNYSEAPHMMKRNGIYYLSYSGGKYWNETYNVQYCTASSPTGPWTYKGYVLANNGPFAGNGHHAFVKRPGCDEYYIAYHRYQNGPPYTTRVVALDRLYFKSNGDIMQVNQTWAGVPARPAGAPCMVSNPIANGTYWIQSRVNANTGGPLVMEITGCNQGAGANVATWTANNSCNNQRWTLTYSDNFYKIVSAEPNALSLDLSGCSHAIGADLKAWTQNGWDCQLYRIEQAGPAGYFRIMSKQSGYVADIASASNVPGADIAVWEWYGQNNQLWKFSSTLPTAPAARIAGTASNEELAIYPNPANTDLTINFDKLLPVTGVAKNVQVKLVNLLGVVVRTIAIQPGSRKYRIDTRDIPNGSYYLQVNDGSKSTSKLVFIRHGN
jgi:hypothetical protein